MRNKSSIFVICIVIKEKLHLLYSNRQDCTDRSLQVHRATGLINLAVNFLWTCNSRLTQDLASSDDERWINVAIKITSSYFVTRWRAYDGDAQSSIRDSTRTYKVGPPPTGAVSTKRHLWQRNSALGFSSKPQHAPLATLRTRLIFIRAQDKNLGERGREISQSRRKTRIRPRPTKANLRKFATATPLYSLTPGAPLIGERISRWTPIDRAINLLACKSPNPLYSLVT